jgi:pentatricopeptide repeat protein
MTAGKASGSGSYGSSAALTTTAQRLTGNAEAPALGLAASSGGGLLSSSSSSGDNSSGGDSAVDADDDLDSGVLAAYARCPPAQPDAITYGSLMAALERGGQWRRALALFEEMQAAGLRVSSLLVLTLLRAKCFDRYPQLGLQCRCRVRFSAPEPR